MKQAITNQTDRPGSVDGELVACYECDQLQYLPVLAPGQIARCGICHARLSGYPKGGVNRSIALFILAFILWLLSNVFPFLMLDIQGRQEVTTLIGASWSLYNAGMGEVAVVVFLTSVLVPGLVIANSLYVLLAVRYKLALPAVRPVLAWISYLRPWGMLDVFMLGVLVAYVKLGDMATLHTGPSLFAFAGLIIASAAATASFETALLWRQLRQRGADCAG